MYKRQLWYLRKVETHLANLRSIFGEYDVDPLSTAELHELDFRKLVMHCTDPNPPDEPALEALRAEAAKLIGALVEGRPLDRGDAFAMACHRRGIYEHV